MKTQKHLYKKIYKTVSVLLIIFTFYIVIMPDTALALVADSSKTKITDQDDFDKKFREARDSIDKEEWAKAAEKFKELADKYPNNKSTDAALYWLAFSYKKQKKIKEANAVLDRLTKEFSDSSWADDARVMKMEVMPLLAGFGTNDVFGVFAPSLSTSRSVASISSAPEYQTALGNLLSADSKIPLEREDEIKLAAFQSLLAADTKRAIEILGDIIKPDSKASESLKRYALRALRNSYRTSPQLTQQLREILINNLQKQPNSKVGTEIIYTLGSINDEQSIIYLAKFYVSENNAETKKAIINAFGSNSLGYFYTFSTDSTTLTTSNSNLVRKTEFDSLLEIVRTEKNTELRQLAFSKLLRFGNLTANAQFVGTISQLYDSETDEDFKLSIIRMLGDIKQNQASKKLLDIAKNEKSDKLKLEAIRALRTSRDPE
ncbi:MAG: HEAT repeat domain-containing protein, partial [Acidobacteriota bacterium]